jgi:hypothetical protein
MKIAFVSLLTICAFGGRATMAQNLVLNGSFEAPAISANSSLQTIPTSWTGNDVFIINGDFSPGYPLPQDGQQYVLLGHNSSLSQSLTIGAGTYVLSWHDSSEFNGPTAQAPYSVTVTDSMSNTVANQNFDSNATALRVWAQRSMTLVLGADTYTLHFQGHAPAFGEKPLLDNVSLTSQLTNQPPDCANAQPSVSTIWPPNKKFASVNILGVTDPDNDPVTITIDSIFQDEAVESGNSGPDGKGLGTSTAQVRAERDGNGNGRVYHIGYTASDGNGGTCTGEVTVCVPHDQGQGYNCIDGGALYNSTVSE